MTATWIPAPPAAETFGQRLRLLRLGLGDISIKEASARCSLPTATWNTWERGALPRNMAAAVVAIAEATGVDPGWLMWGSDTRPATAPAVTEDDRSFYGRRGNKVFGPATLTDERSGSSVEQSLAGIAA